MVAFVEREYLLTLEVGEAHKWVEEAQAEEAWPVLPCSLGGGHRGQRGLHPDGSFEYWEIREQKKESVHDVACQIGWWAEGKELWECTELQFWKLLSCCPLENWFNDSHCHCGSSETLPGKRWCVQFQHKTPLKKVLKNHLFQTFHAWLSVVKVCNDEPIEYDIWTTPLFKKLLLSSCVKQFLAFSLNLVVKKNTQIYFVNASYWSTIS